jgi:hypothetical protein
MPQHHTTHASLILGGVTVTHDRIDLVDDAGEAMMRILSLYTWASMTEVLRGWLFVVLW